MILNFIPVLLFPCLPALLAQTVEHRLAAVDLELMLLQDMGVHLI